MIILVNGGIQNASNILVPLGSIKFQLNVDATVIASPFGFVCAEIPIVFQFDQNGDILPNAPAVAAQIWSNAELNPQNLIGLGTYYLVTLYDQNGAVLNAVPMWWQFPDADGSIVDISTMVPFATIGGNVIFYPTIAAFTIPPPTATTLGGVFSNAGTTGKFISSINTDGTVSVSGAAGADTDVQVNSNGLFYGDSVFTYDPSAGRISIGTTLLGLPTDLTANNPNGIFGLSIQETLNSTHFIPLFVIGQALTGSGAPLAQGAFLAATATGTLGATGSQNEAYVNPGFGQSITSFASVQGSYHFATSVGAGNVTYVIGVLGQTGNEGTGVVANSIGFAVGAATLFNTGGGSVTNNRDFYAGAQTSATNNYGFYAEDFGAGANSYAIYTAGTGKSFLGGPLFVGHNLTAAYALTVDGAGLGNGSYGPVQILNSATCLRAINFTNGAIVADIQITGTSAATADFNINVQNGAGQFEIFQSGLQYTTTVSGGKILFKNTGATNPNFEINLDSGDVLLSFGHGDQEIIGSFTEEIILSTISATTDSSLFLLPANSIIDSVVARVTQAISGGSTPTTWEVGDTLPSLARFISPTAVATTTAVGLNHMQGSVSTDALGPVQISASKVRITLDQVPGQGKIRITVAYRQFIAPTS